jgi:DNA-binding response OmpR family regulator
LYKIFIVEDDESIRGAITRELEKWDYTVAAASDYGAVADEFAAFMPHLVLMDVNLPSRDGFHWCKRIRETSSVPVLFISSRDSTMDIVMAVGMGGDDYISKPFSMDVLLAKISALLRRAYSYKEDRNEAVEHGGAVLDLASGTVRHGGAEVGLTRNEIGILRLLMGEGGSVVSRERIMRELWKDESFIDDNTLTVNINRLRKKLAEIGLEGFIGTAKGRGYEIK